MGFGTGAFVAAGDGGGSSISICLAGDGVGEVDGFRLLVFSFAFSLVLRFAPVMSFGFSLGDGVADEPALTFVFGFWFVPPPAGIPASA